MKKVIFFSVIVLILAFNTAIAANTDAVLQYNRGIDYYKTGQYDDAIASFRESIRLDPGYIDAYYNLGSVLEYLQQYEAALAVFKQIIVRQPNDYDSIYKAAWISAYLGQPEKAKSYLSIIPPNCARAKDAQTLAIKLDAQMSTALPTVTKSAPKLSQSNNLYKNIAGPTGITSDNLGNVYIAGFNDNSIIKITPDEKRIIYIKDPQISGPIGLARDKNGNLYIANYNKDNVLKVSNLGEISVLISNVKKPYYLHIDGNILFVSCQGTNSVLKYKLGG